MIKLENTQVLGWDAAIRGMRNPKNSWNRIDSGIGYEQGKLCDSCSIPGAYESCSCDNFVLGPNDHDLMMRLSRGGAVHAKYRRYIDVYVDITAPLYWWKEFETYRTVVADNPFDIEMNSCSTMHKITEKEFTLDDFSCEHLFAPSLYMLSQVIIDLNFWREAYLISDDGERRNYILSRFDLDYVGNDYTKKSIWWQLIQLLPASYMQKRTLKLNYEVCAQLYQWRNHHPMGEGHWDEVIKWIKELPYSEIITLEEKQCES